MFGNLCAAMAAFDLDGKVATLQLAWLGSIVSCASQTTHDTHVYVAARHAVRGAPRTTALRADQMLHLLQDIYCTDSIIPFSFSFEVKLYLDHTLAFAQIVIHCTTGAASGQLDKLPGNMILHIQTDGNIEGQVWAGMTGYYSFSGIADDNAALEDPEEMSSLREDYTHIEWHLPGLDGDTVHFDSRTITKPTILAIQGSWCPNCMAEGRVLDQYYREFEGTIDVFGLSYEYSGTLEKATAAVQKMERDLGTSFPMVIATYNAQQDRNAVLPLEQIRSYPTSIMLDHQGNVVKIHTGFYGPSTKEYEAYVKETKEELEALVAKANG